MKFDCPHCQRPTFGLKDKLLAGKWIDVNCAECGGRSCNQPVFLALLYFAFVWNFLLFGYLAYIEYQMGAPKMAAIYASVMVIGWIVLEAIGLWIPLSRMRAREAGKKPADDPHA